MTQLDTHLMSPTRAVGQVSQNRDFKVITRSDVKEVRRLYQGGMSSARIRQQLRLDESLNRLQTVVNKPW